MKRALVTGAGGFIGSHMCARLVAEGYSVIGLSRSKPKVVPAIEAFITCDLRFIKPTDFFFENIDEVYNFAAEVGGIGFIGDEANAAIMLRNSTLIDINVLEACRHNKVPKLFFASSACVYNVKKRFFHEGDAYVGHPSNEFAWQKLFAERLYQSYAENYGMDIAIGRLFNTYGPGMTWRGGREKSVAALCRKIAQAKDGGVIEVWGSGQQTRSFTYIDDCIEGIWRLMQSGDNLPLNIGPQQEVSIAELVRAISAVAGKTVFCDYGGGLTGVSHICSDNTEIRKVLGWEPTTTIQEGLKIAYPWVEKQVLDSVG